MNARIDIQNLPIDYSARGDNAYYCDYCNFAGHRPAYAACLDRIKHGVHNANFNDCTTAIQNRNCPAMTMRAQEIEAGYALFYLDRADVQRQVEQRLARAGIRINRDPNAAVTYKPFVNTFEKSAKTETVAPSTPSTEREVSGYAAAINKAMSEMTAEKPSIPKSSVVSSKKSVSADFNKTEIKASQPRIPTGISKGMSLAEIAKLMSKK